VKTYYKTDVINNAVSYKNEVSLQYQLECGQRDGRPAEYKRRPLGKFCNCIPDLTITLHLTVAELNIIYQQHRQTQAPISQVFGNPDPT